MGFLLLAICGAAKASLCGQLTRGGGLRENATAISWVALSSRRLPVGESRKGTHRKKSLKQSLGQVPPHLVAWAVIAPGQGSFCAPGARLRVFDPSMDYPATGDFYSTVMVTFFEITAGLWRMCAKFAKASWRVCLPFGRSRVTWVCPLP